MPDLREKTHSRIRFQCPVDGTLVVCAGKTTDAIMRLLAIRGTCCPLCGRGLDPFVIQAFTPNEPDDQ